MPEFKVPFKVVVRGELVIEANGPGEAESIAETGKAVDLDFLQTAELVDWVVCGPPKEVK